MGVRVKFREVEAGTVTPPLQQNPSNQSGNFAASQIATVHSSQHSVESELLGSRPRYVRHNTSSGLFLYCVVQLVGLGAIFYSLFRRHPDHIGEIVLNVSLLLAVFTGLFGFLYWDSRRIRDLLRHADAYKATVIAVEKGVHYSHVHSVYVSKEGQTTEAVVQVHPDIVASENLSPQASFTLLVSPDNPKQFMPYFLATRTFSVVPVDATHVSSEVSARIATQAASLPVQGGGRLGVVEPELLGIIPRHLCANHSQRRARAWYFGALATLGTLLVIAYQAGLLPTALKGFPFIFQLVGQTIGAHLAGKVRRRNALLQNGIPARAMITLEEDLSYNEQKHFSKRDISFSYQFEGNGEVQHGSFTMQRRRAWQLGITEGSTFTVLHDSKKPSDHLPYFQIDGIEVIGAMGAKITRP